MAERPPHNRISEEYIRMWPRHLFDLAAAHGKGKTTRNALEGVLGKKKGIYVLYRGGVPYYIGRTDDLFKRLATHSNIDSRYGNFWDTFCAFTVRDPSFRKQLEAILIAAMPTANGSRPREFKRVSLPAALKREYMRSVRGELEPRSL
jgi:hypothetical protein